MSIAALPLLCYNTPIGGDDLKSLIKSISLCLLVTMILALFTSCTYNPPEGYTEEHHTYEEILTFAKSLDPNATVSKKYTDTTIDEGWGRDFREWDAVINGVECHVSSVGDIVWNSGFLAGEFARQYYVIDTDYDYLVLQKIVLEKQPDWKMAYTDIGSIYNWNNLLSVQTPYADNKELSVNELEIAWEEAFEVYQEYASLPVRKEAWFPVSIPVLASNPNGENEYITYSILVMKDFSAEGKIEFFEEYKEAWDLMDSNLPIKE